MAFSIDLEYTPFCPQNGLLFTERSFDRRSVPFTERVIAPTADALRDLGVQIFHCNHGRFLEMFPQWQSSTTQQEREAHRVKANLKDPDVPGRQDRDTDLKDGLPMRGWHSGWQEQHRELVWKSEAWGMKQRDELYPQLAIPAPVRPKGSDLLICEGDQFRRLLAERGIRALFYMGFETDCCLVSNQEYGSAKMTGPNCLCTVVRDGTTTYEAAETLEGFWRTRTAIINIESRYGYSITSAGLVNSVSRTAV